MPHETDSVKSFSLDQAAAVLRRLERQLSDADFTLDPDSVEGDPSTWPSWCDEDVWVPTDPGPDATDLEWAVREFNADDLVAPEAASQHASGLGLIPLALAHAINRTSLAGSDATADSILHEGSDPSWCPCLDCTMARTARYAD